MCKKVLGISLIMSQLVIVPAFAHDPIAEIVEEYRDLQRRVEELRAMVEKEDDDEPSEFSERFAAELFLGSTFSMSYSDDGGRDGFGNASALGRVSADVLWKNRLAKGGLSLGCEGKEAGEGDEADSWKLNSPYTIHFGLEALFSSFPSEENEGGLPESQTISLADSFAGRLYMLYQPGDWAHYVKGESPAVGENPSVHAFRFGILAKLGMIARDLKDVDGDTTVETASFGFRLDHYKTEHPDPRRDTVNRFPIFFIEANLAWFEEFARQRDDVRGVINSGVRLTGGKIPFYAGVHVNLGKGEDDVRVFGGFLFRLNKLESFLR